MALATVCVIAIPALAAFTSITVDPSTYIPVGVYATYTANTDSNPPTSISSFAWSWAGTNCTWTTGGSGPSWPIYENLVGSFTVKCVATYAGLPPPSPSSQSRTVEVTVAVPVSDSIDTVNTINIDTSLPVSGNTQIPTVYFITNTGAGPAGPAISGSFDRLETPSGGTGVSKSVSRSDDRTIVVFGFEDPNNAFSTALANQTFYQVTSVNRIGYVQGCLGEQPKKKMTARTVKWIKVDATHWKLTIS